ncbi:MULTISPECIES: hypothetical protein [unclassified Rhodosalinus]|uniref:hypothetical protein n=1 Tax=unclassified Rhodosalinus TaxID=2630183 RepID=UPI0035231D97
MIRHALVHATGLALMALAATTVEGEALPGCGPRDAMLEELARGWGESRRAAGLASGALVELFANPDTGSWTLTATTAAGRTCLLASGEAFSAHDAPPPGRDG